MTPPAAASGRLAAFADPDSSAGQSRERSPQIVPLADVAADPGISRLKGARFVTAIGRLAPGGGDWDEQRCTVYAQARQVVLTEPAAGAASPPSLAISAAALTPNDAGPLSDVRGE